MKKLLFCFLCVQTFFSCEKDENYDSNKCSFCSGKGLTRCDVCKGSGRAKYNDLYSIRIECPDCADGECPMCAGTGTSGVICPICNGTGKSE